MPAIPALLLAAALTLPVAALGDRMNPPTVTQTAGTSAGWVKHPASPVLGGALGTCFDVTVLKEGGRWRMWFSWRPRKSIALVESPDGIHWSEPRIVLGPNPETGWEDDINRPVVVRRSDGYRMWYTGQARGRSWIGCATSPDGVTWTRARRDPVVSPEAPWEKVAVMCPHVLWDAKARLYKMWYSGGEQYEPDAIGYATSPDGLNWTKLPSNPVFRPDPVIPWEQHKVTACQVVREGDWYLMFYIGFRDVDHAQIGLARSRDGIGGWERHPSNPIIHNGASPDAWDCDAVYKPSAVRDGNRWLLWYNGRRGGVEQIGLATHEGADLWAGAKTAGSAAQAPVLDHAALGEGCGADASWFRENIPFFECPDRQIQEIYYYRWGVYRKHLRQTPDGWIVTEFLPDVPWAGKHNSISCAAGHHFYEGRWLHDSRYLDEYARFWFRGGGSPRLYSFWAANAIYARCLVSGDMALATDLLPDLVANYRAWEKDHLDPNGLFWQIDDRDGMEVSIGGSGYRPTINSYLYGDAVAIARIAKMAGQKELASEFGRKAARLKTLVEEKLWDKDAAFFKTLPRGEGAKLVDVREEIGFVPWYFELPGAGYEAAWKQLLDPEGFCAPYGPTTAERRHPRFMFQHEHDCLWNGPSWPYATTQTLVAMANLLNDYKQSVVDKKDYLALLGVYARSQYKDGHPWIAEDLDPLTGRWIVDLPRSVDYNHSGYCDLVISGLVGLRAQPDDTLVVNPLVPEGTWDYFALDNVLYHGHRVAVVYDKSGTRYHRGAGLQVLVDGRRAAASRRLGRLAVKL